MTRSSLPATVRYAGPSGSVSLSTADLRLDIFGRASLLEGGVETAVDKPGLDALSRYQVWTDFVTAVKGLGDGSA